MSSWELKQEKFHRFRIIWSYSKTNWSLDIIAHLKVPEIVWALLITLMNNRQWALGRVRLSIQGTQVPTSLGRNNLLPNLKTHLRPWFMKWKKSSFYSSKKMQISNNKKRKTSKWSRCNWKCKKWAVKMNPWMTKFIRSIENWKQVRRGVRTIS